jgi:hypothetical protein
VPLVLLAMNSPTPPDPLSTEDRLQQRLADVLAAPPQSAARAKAMGQFLRLVMHLPGINRVNHQDYLLALNQTWEWMSRNIDEFKPSTNSLERDLSVWINGYLYWRIRDLYASASTKQPQVSLNEEIFEGETYLDLLSESGFSNLTLGTLDDSIYLLQQQEYRKIATQIETWIQFDPDRKLQSCHPRGCDRCHCQILSYRLIIKDPPDSFTDIAKDLDIPYQTLVSHWKRSCLKILQAQAQNLGYEPGKIER